MKRPVLRTAAALLALLALSTESTALPPAADAADTGGPTLRLPHAARRIVALAPNLTELAYAAGAGDAVVAVSRFSDYPAAARTKPVIGDAFAIDYEALAALKPDLILVWGSGTPERAKARLRSLGFAVDEVEIRSVAALVQAVRDIGRLAGTQPAAEARARALAADWAGLQRDYAGRTPVRVFYELWDAPLMTLGAQHLISSAIDACGGRNVFADLRTLTAAVSREAAVQRDPELVLSAGHAAGPAPAGAWAAFAAMSATRHGQFAHLDGDLIGRAGPRFVEGARQLCEAIAAARSAGETPVRR